MAFKNMKKQKAWVKDLHARRKAAKLLRKSKAASYHLKASLQKDKIAKDNPSFGRKGFFKMFFKQLIQIIK